jgi:hypothetical protein
VEGARDGSPGEPEEALGIEGGALRRFLAAGNDYVLTRFVLLRALGVVYLAAFSTAALQLVPLVGRDGLLPAAPAIDRLVASSGSRLAAFRQLPSLFVFTGASDTARSVTAWIGVALSAAVALGATNALVMVVLWALYMSLEHVGQTFYNFGWEIQLLETGLLAAFLCPLRSLRPFPKAPPSPVAVWLFRWLAVRVMLGAGLIKLRGDPCWRDLSCLDHHFETQPNPGPLSPFFHRLPAGVLHGGVAFNHLVEVVAPFFAFWPRRARLVAGALFIGFQLVLILSGNLAFLNWLTIVPAIACLDDRALGRLLPCKLVRWARAETTDSAPTRAALYASGAYALVVAVLSLAPVANLLSPRQEMNRSFEPLHLVNTYGAFGSVNATRYEVVLEGTNAEDPDDPAAEWRAYELPSKPGALDKPLTWITPYHRRLDWQMWFLPFGRADDNPWFIHLVAKLLAGDAEARALFVNDPFPDAPPRFVRADLYAYRFSSRPDRVWDRDLAEPYLRPVARDDAQLVRYVERAGFADTAAKLRAAAPQPPR